METAGVHRYSRTISEVSAPEAPSRLRRRRRSHPPRRRRRILAGIGILLGFVLSGGAGAALYFSPAIAAAFQDFGHSIHQQATASASPTARPSPVASAAAATSVPTAAPIATSGSAFTVLLLGSDNDAKFSANVVLTQSMILARVDPVTKHVTMLSIPRDLNV